MQCQTSCSQTIRNMSIHVLTVLICGTSALQSQKAVSAYFTSKQSQKAVSAYFEIKQILPFGFARQTVFLLYYYHISLTELHNMYQLYVHLELKVKIIFSKSYSLVEKRKNFESEKCKCSLRSNQIQYPLHDQSTLSHFT